MANLELTKEEAWTVYVALMARERFDDLIVEAGVDPERKDEAAEERERIKVICKKIMEGGI